MSKLSEIREREKAAIRGPNANITLEFILMNDIPWLVEMVMEAQLLMSELTRLSDEKTALFRETDAWLRRANS